MRQLVCAFSLLAGMALWGAVPARIVNTFELRPREGTAELEWVTPSTVRFLRTWTPREGIRKPVTLRPVPVSVTEEEGPLYSFESRYLRIRAGYDADRVEIMTAGGAPVTELRVRREGARVAIEQPVKTPEHFYGLGARTGALDVRGTAVTTRDAFFISSAGYGESFPQPGEYIFDFAANNPRAVIITMPGDQVEVFVHMGPGIKEILEERMSVAGPVDAFDALDLEIRDPKRAPASAPTWKTLAETVHALINASLSAKLIPAFDLAPYAGNDGTLFARAVELASLTPILYAPSGVPRLQERRRRLAPYLLSYTREARDRGFPVIRPLVADFDREAGSLGRNEQFLLGDELLVAPVLNAAGDVKVYFPRGVWTDIESDQTYPGRQETALRVPPGVLPMFARNGTIVPLAQDGDSGALELHYFPSLGAEFFLSEESDPEVSQFHAAPAGDLIRLESESRVARTYEWVLHHNTGCQSVESGGTEYRRVADAAQIAPGTWHYDAARRRLRIRVSAAAGGDEIVHIRM